MLKYIFLSISFISTIIYGHSQSNTDSIVPTDTIGEFGGKKIDKVLILGDADISGDFSFGITYNRYDLIFSQITDQLKISRNDAEANEFYRNSQKVEHADIFIYSYSLNKTVLFAYPLSTHENEGAATFHPNGREMFFTRSYSKFGKIHFEICYAVREKGQWVEKPKKALKSNSTNYAYPCYSKNGNTLYFSADMKTGSGGFDIYSIEYSQEDSSWSRPYNLGNIINTPGDEIYPKTYKDSLLLFASNGHMGNGGLDLYYYDLFSDESSPVNFQQPFNSAADDIEIIFQPGANNKGYIISNRSSKNAPDELYNFTIDYAKPDSTIDSMMTIIENIVIDNSMIDILNIKLKDFAEALQLDHNIIPDIAINIIDDSKKDVEITIDLPQKKEEEVRNLIEDLYDFFRNNPDVIAMESDQGFLIEQNKTVSKVNDDSDIAITVNSEEEISSVVQAVVAEYMSSNSNPYGDSIDVTIEILDPNIRSTGRRKQTYTLTLPSANDYDVEVEVDKRTVTLNNPVVTGSSYTVLVGTYPQYQDLSAFNKLQEVRCYPGKDKKIRYTSGTAKTKAEAELILKDALNNGYKNCSITTLREMQSQASDAIYGVQIYAGKKRKNKKAFKDVDFVDEYYNDYDNIYRYALGRYSTKEEASKTLEAIKQKGYKNAFISNFAKQSYSQNLGK